MGQRSSWGTGGVAGAPFLRQHFYNTFQKIEKTAIVHVKKGKRMLIESAQTKATLMLFAQFSSKVLPCLYKPRIWLKRA